MAYSTSSLMAGTLNQVAMAAREVTAVKARTEAMQMMSSPPGQAVRAELEETEG
jgi:hypothetical protein